MLLREVGHDDCRIQSENCVSDSTCFGLYRWNTYLPLSLKRDKTIAWNLHTIFVLRVWIHNSKFELATSYITRVIDSVSDSTRFWQSTIGTCISCYISIETSGTPRKWHFCVQTRLYEINTMKWLPNKQRSIRNSHFFKTRVKNHENYNTWHMLFKSA